MFSQTELAAKPAVFALDALPLNYSPSIKFCALELQESVIDAQSFILQHSFTTIMIRTTQTNAP